jgi:hypothetical protein|nr:MAG TPA: hypothetical protein [Caudoviricetes sp.]
MLNREKYAKEIVDVALKDETFALMDGNICACSDVQGCTSCAFYDSDDCIISKQEWANSEYVEPPVDWSKIAVDTPILVRDYEKETWEKRHFAKYENGIVCAWSAGSTSWSVSASSNIVGWKFAKLAESEE